MEELPRLRQPWLLHFANPLREERWKAFFAAVPHSPGVYLMLGDAGTLLYAGKAKDLRTRLLSYRRALPEEAPRKVIRMLCLVREIRFEVLADETAAFIRENALLRTLRPPFNSLNTRPDSYPFIALRFIGSQVRFRLTMVAKRQGDILFGAFKGPGTTREAYAALLRLLWAVRNQPDRFQFPMRLMRRNPPSPFTLEFPVECQQMLKRFLDGKSRTLLPTLTLMLLENESIHPFAYKLLQDDLDTLQNFYERSARRNWKLRRNHGVKGRLIAQERMDDLLVLERARPDDRAPEKSTNAQK